MAFLNIQFLHWRKEVNRESLKSDLLAGLTGMVVLLPQGVVFAMIAGLPPIYGLYSAMVIPVVAALFQSSNHLISGPTTAMSLVVFSTISAFAEPTTSEFILLAIALTLIAGIMQLVLGLAKMGSLINFVSHSVIVGFTAGAAILIATSQIKLILGISMPRGLEFYDSWIYILGHMPEINFTVFLVGVSTLLLAIVLKAISRNIPYLLLAMIGGSILNYLMDGQELGVDMVSELPRGLPQFRMPAFSLHEAQMIMPGAFAIALLGLIEAVAIGRAIGMQSGQRINGNQEFISQGLSNITGSFFSCYMGSGSFTRSGVNFQAGGKTPLAAIFAAIFLVLVLIFVAPMAGYLPIPALGGIILLVAYNMIDFVHIRSIIRSSKREAIVMGITFLATLLFHLEFAIYFGVFFSLIFFLQETSRPEIKVVAPDPSHLKRKFLEVASHKLEECPQLKILQIEGSIFFGSIEHLAARLALEKEKCTHILIILSRTHLLDSAGAEWLANEARDLKKKGGSLYLSSAKKQANNVLKRGNFDRSIGVDRIFRHKEEAISHIIPMLSQTACAMCSKRIFSDCPELELKA